MSKVIPDGWEERKLGRLFDIKIGGTPSRNNPLYWDVDKESENRWVSIRDLNGRFVRDTIEHLSDDGVKNSNVKRIYRGTVIMSFKLSVGRVAIAGADLYTNEAIASFSPLQAGTVDRDYLYQGLQFWNLLEEVDQAVKGFTLNKEKLSNITGLFPPFPEQQTIASILTSVDEVIEKTQSQINKLQDLKKGTMNELLTRGIGHTEFKDSPVGRIPKGWEVMNVSDLLEFKNGLNKEKSAFGSGLLIVNYMDVYKNQVIFSENLYGRVNLTSSEIQRFSVLNGDVFFTRTSETPEEIGLSSVYIGNDEDIVFSGFVLRGRHVGTSLHPEFSGYCFRADYLRSQITGSCSYTTRALTNGTLLGKVVLALPPVSEQQRIASILSSIDTNIEEIQRKLQQNKSLKKSLMQDLLTGKVRVTVH